MIITKSNKLKITAKHKPTGKIIDANGIIWGYPTFAIEIIEGHFDELPDDMEFLGDDVVYLKDVDIDIDINV